MLSPRRLIPVPLVLLALAGAGCGEERTAKDVKDGGAESAATESAGGGASSASVDALAAAVGKDVSKAPTIPATKGEAPADLVQKDVVVGDGEAAKLGDTVDVRYTLAVWGGEKVESSWDSTPNNVAFPLEKGGLIDGWINGVPGMKPGGRRVLVVPAEQGYGDQGTPNGSVPPGATLVFVIDLVKATPKPQG
ncbi:FKBP-type peptidyl-prolyl cis-trans isomerase [Patulibacter americanus]|uniref:FKBP-type peptidyl-prolyl cis-trans isomerase n=1 Tax=Patulibacter americanus TaxID=588672 RepID=UPI0003B50727|nr:FKBP-type peptidyl-prolyl cis-trans isomerase [Patulibacter americanus]